MPQSHNNSVSLRQLAIIVDETVSRNRLLSGGGGGEDSNPYC